VSCADSVLKKYCPWLRVWRGRGLSPHCPIVSLQLHNFAVFRTSRTSSFCTVAWQLARFQLTRRIARSLDDSWASCLPVQGPTSYIVGRTQESQMVGDRSDVKKFAASGGVKPRSHRLKWTRILNTCKPMGTSTSHEPVHELCYLVDGVCSQWAQSRSM